LGRFDGFAADRREWLENREAQYGADDEPSNGVSGFLGTQLEVGRGREQRDEAQRVCGDAVVKEV
jgi:hypothetical protein